jgi:hypothetical protein
MLLVSIVLFLLVLKNVVLEIDFGATKGKHILAWKKTDIDKAKDIDCVKTLAKKHLDENRQHAINDSKLAIKNFWMLLILFLIQLYLLLTRPKPTAKL